MLVMVHSTYRVGGVYCILDGLASVCCILVGLAVVCCSLDGVGCI